VSSTAAPGPAAAAAGWFYGWWAIVPAVFVILLVTNGLTVGGIAAFDPLLIAELGVQRADIKLGDAIQLGVTAFVTLGSGWLADRFGVRPVMLVGSVALAWGFFALGHVESLSDYYWSRFWMGIGLSGAGLAICVVAVSRWFVLRRGRALGIVLAGTSLGNAFFPWVFTRLIDLDGWREAGQYAGWALLALVVVIMLAVREWPESMGLRPYGADRLAAKAPGADVQGEQLTYAQILARREFWLMGIAAFGTFYSILAVNNNMILHMQNLGVSREIGALVAVPLFLAGLVGKLASGWLTDIFGRKPVWLVSLGCMFVAAASLTAMSATLVAFAAIVMGLGWGANYTLLQAVAGDVFGARSLGRVMGAVTVLDAGGGALGPYLTARLADAYGNYQVGFLAVTVLIGIAFVCAALLRVATPDVEVRKS
jgi:MFS family permease